LDGAHGPRRPGRYHHPILGTDVLLILIVILIIVVIWRGPKTLPEIGRMFGRGVREAREEIAKGRSSDDTPTDGPGSAGSTS
jgi:mttA/Hcf106 family protein